MLKRVIIGLGEDINLMTITDDTWQPNNQSKMIVFLTLVYTKPPVIPLEVIFPGAQWKGCLHLLLQVLSASETKKDMITLHIK